MSQYSRSAKRTRGDVMARRGFFAELQHQAQVHAREQQRAQAAAERQHAAAIREAERTRKAAERGWRPVRWCR